MPFTARAVHCGQRHPRWPGPCPFRPPVFVAGQPGRAGRSGRSGRSGLPRGSFPAEAAGRPRPPLSDGGGTSCGGGAGAFVRERRGTERGSGGGSPRRPAAPRGGGGGCSAVTGRGAPSSAFTAGERERSHRRSAGSSRPGIYGPSAAARSPEAQEAPTRRPGPGGCAASGGGVARPARGRLLGALPGPGPAPRRPGAQRPGQRWLGPRVRAARAGFGVERSAVCSLGETKRRLGLFSPNYQTSPLGSSALSSSSPPGPGRLLSVKRLDVKIDPKSFCCRKPGLW